MSKPPSAALKPRIFLIAGLVATAGMATVVLVRAAAQPRWIALASNDWAHIEIEPVLYECPGQNRYFNHLRVVNKTGRSLALDLQDPGVGWPNLGASDQTTLGEGSRRGSVNEWVELALVDNFKRKERNLILAQRAGRASAIPAGGTLDYFIPAQIGTRAQVNRDYGRFPLWMKAKAYWPWAPFPPNLILVLRGAVSLTDGAITKSLVAKRDLGLPLPLKWKTMPANARVMKNP